MSRMKTVLIATSNAGKLRDFAGAAASHGIEVRGIPGFEQLPRVSLCWQMTPGWR